MNVTTNKSFSKNINWKKDIMPEIQKSLNLWASQQIKPTLRGMFYNLVSKNLLENTPTRYNYLSKFTAEARERSEIAVELRYNKYGQEYPHMFKSDEILPIDCFADNGRFILDIDDIYETAQEFYDKGVEYFVKDISVNYKIPRWYKQPDYVEVWVEKDAMANTLNSIINVAGERQVRIVPTRGQESVTFAWEHVQRLKLKQKMGKQIHIRYFGDLDPSGEAIEQELISKLTLDPYKLKGIDFKRVGVTMKQKEDFKLISNTDSQTMAKLKRDPNRFTFMQKYDLNENELFQIEVDALQALQPVEFKTLVLESVDEFFNEDIYQDNLNDRTITPTKKDLDGLAIQWTVDLLASMQIDHKEDSEEND